MLEARNIEWRAFGGRFQEAVGTTIQTASIDTNEDQRDQHFRSGDFLDGEKFRQ
jgi:polyisoprenoid-binding protein YceI